MADSVLRNHAYYVTTHNSVSEIQSAHNDGVSLHYVRRANQVGMLVWTVPDGHGVLDVLEDDLIFRVRLGVVTRFELTDRQNWTWYDEFVGVYREKQTSTDGDGNLYHMLYIPHANEVLSRQIVGYYAGTADYSQWTSTDAGTVMYDLVSRNAADDSAPLRIRMYDKVNDLRTDGPPTTGLTIDYSSAWRPLLEVLQELGELANAYFDVEWYLFNPLTPLSVSYSVSQLGTDISTNTVFALGLDNIRSSSKVDNRLQEKTVAIVGGKNTGSNRVTSVRTGANYSTTHSYEVFVDARDKIAAELSDLGDARLSELESDTLIDAEILQSQGYMYKRDYDFGDRIQVYFDNTSVDKLINEVSVTFSQNSDVRILIGLENV